MFLQRTRPIGTSCATVVAFMLAPVGLCQTISNQEDEQDASETVEEIVVYGQKSLTQLRIELHEAEDRAFALFNSLNNEDEYDILCYREAPTGSHISRRICRPNYVSQARSLETRAFLRGQPPPSAWAIIQHKDKILREKMETLVVERPEFLKAINEFAEAKENLESEHKRRCEGRIILCEQ